MLEGIIKDQSDDSGLYVNVDCLKLSLADMLIVVWLEAEVAKAEEIILII